jgi:hypothetical protein
LKGITRGYQGRWPRVLQLPHALVLRKALQDRLEAAGHGEVERSHVIDDLAGLQEIELNVQGKAYRLRTETKGTLAAVFSACGIALLPTLRPARLAPPMPPWLRRRDTTSATASQVVDSEEVCPAWCRR